MSHARSIYSQYTIYDGMPPELKKFLKINSETLKDQDYLLLQNYKEFNLNITWQQKLQLIDIIQKDSQFLSDNYLMDYSILVGIEKVSNQAVILSEVSS